MRTTAAVPARPVRRTLTALASLSSLALLLAGLPAALVLLAGNPLPAGAPTMEQIWAALTSPDDGTLFLHALAVVGWLAWAGFTGSVVLEVAARLAGRRPPAIPGLRGPQRFAALLVAAVATALASPTLTSTAAAVVDAPVVAAASTGVTAPVEPGPVEASGASEPSLPPGHTRETVVHLVGRGEGLLDLQDRYGVPWQRIAEANYGVAQPDGRTLERGHTRIYPGWRMTIPAAGAAPAPGAGARHDRPPAPTGGDGGAVEPRLAYEVAPGDWMWHIAGRYLGDPERYREIAALNPGYAGEARDYPDHIEPGWTLQLPPDAVDSGPSAHATGSATPAAPEKPPAGAPAPPGGHDLPGRPSPLSPDPPPTPPLSPDPPPTPPVPATPPASPPAPATPPVAGLGAAPEAATGGDEAGGGVSEAGGSADQHLERFAPAALAGAGLLTALVLGAAAHQLRRRRQEHREGYRLAPAPARRLEKTLRAAEQPLDTARLAAAMDHLATGLARRPGGPPDIAGAMVDTGAVHVLLAAPCPDPPAPWQDRGDRWTLPAGAQLPPAEPQAARAALPVLAAVGSQAGIHLLLNLERLGVLAIHGDPDRARGLLRYLAAEVACQTWSDPAEIVVTGFHPRESELLTTLSPRLRPVASVAGAVDLMRRWAAIRSDPAPTAAQPAVPGATDRPRLLFAAAPTPADLATLAGLETELAGLRFAVVATAGANPPRHDAWRVTITPDGVVHVRLPFLRASLTAAELTPAELEPLAETMRAARTAPLRPVPPAPEAEPWAAVADAAGQVQTWAAPAIDATTDVLPVADPARSDPSLDDDLRAWHQAEAGRPRIGVLGPVIVDAAGPPPETRRGLCAELVVYLAQRGARGADAGSLTAALWPATVIGEPARQAILARVRRWLGTDQHGAPWLADGDHYRLAAGYLFDWHLFRRLRARGEQQGPEGGADLRAALGLVRGVPLAGADRPRTPGTRNPYPWLAESAMHPDHIVATIVETAHDLAERCLAAGDPAGARWAVRRAWLADPGRTYDQPWRDLLRAEQADGRADQLRVVLAELMRVRGVTAPEELAPETYRLISCWPRHLLTAGGVAVGGRSGGAGDWSP